MGVEFIEVPPEAVGFERPLFSEDVAEHLDLDDPALDIKNCWVTPHGGICWMPGPFRVYIPVAIGDRISPSLRGEPDAQTQTPPQAPEAQA